MKLLVTWFIILFLLQIHLAMIIRGPMIVTGKRILKGGFDWLVCDAVVIWLADESAWKSKLKRLLHRSVLGFILIGILKLSVPSLAKVQRRPLIHVANSIQGQAPWIFWHNQACQIVHNLWTISYYWWLILNKSFLKSRLRPRSGQWTRDKIYTEFNWWTSQGGVLVLNTVWFIEQATNTISFAPLDFIFSESRIKPLASFILLKIMAMVMNMDITI